MALRPGSTATDTRDVVTELRGRGAAIEATEVNEESCCGGPSCAPNRWMDENAAVWTAMGVPCRPGFGAAGGAGLHLGCCCTTPAIQPCIRRDSCRQNGLLNCVLYPLVTNLAESTCGQLPAGQPAWARPCRETVAPGRPPASGGGCHVLAHQPRFAAPGAACRAWKQRRRVRVQQVGRERTAWQEGWGRRRECGCPPALRTRAPCWQTTKRALQFATATPICNRTHQRG